MVLTELCHLITTLRVVAILAHPRGVVMIIDVFTLSDHLPVLDLLLLAIVRSIGCTGILSGLLLLGLRRWLWRSDHRLTDLFWLLHFSLLLLLNARLEENLATLHFKLLLR